MVTWQMACVFSMVAVKPQNAVELFGQADIDGGLIGGAAFVTE